MNYSTKKKIVALSDLHGSLPQLDPCDVCVICGDIVPCRIQSYMEDSEWWFQNKFKKWLEEIPIDHFVIIPGNHDFYLYKLYKEGDFPFISEKLTILVDQQVKVSGVTIYGSPWVTGLNRWAFNMDEDVLKEHYQKYPIFDSDIILLHGAPSIEGLGIVHQAGWNYMKDFSSPSITEAIKDTKFKYCFNGHIHSGSHFNIENNGRIFRNVSIKNEDYKDVYEPYYFILDITENEN